MLFHDCIVDPQRTPDTLWGGAGAAWRVNCVPRERESHVPGDSTVYTDLPGISVP